MGRNAGSVGLAAIVDNSLRLFVFEEALDLVLLSGTVAAVEPDLPNKHHQLAFKDSRIIRQGLPLSSRRTATIAHPIAPTQPHYRYY